MPDPRLQQSRELVAAGQFKEAMNVLKGLLKDNPQDAQARQLLADVQDRLMLDLQIREKLRKAQAFLAQGQKDAAIRVAQDVLKVVPENQEARALAMGLAELPPPQPEFKPPSPEATVALDAFDLNQPVGPPEQASLQPLEPLSEPEPALTLQPFDAPGDLPPAPSLAESTAAPMESTTLSLGTAQLGAAERAKVEEYLQDGQRLFRSGHFQDAIDVWTRVFILDENNQEAERLIAAAKEQMGANQGQVEHTLTEAIAAFNAGDFVRAQPLLEKVLQIFPGHREAQYYLNRILTAPAEVAAAGPAVGPPAAPEQVSSAGFSGSPDEFELEDNLTMPTGPEMRSGGPPPAVSFQWEAEPEASVPAGPPSPSIPAPKVEAGAPEPFTWEEPAAPPPRAPAAAIPAPVDLSAVAAPAPERPFAPAKSQVNVSKGLIVAIVAGLLVVAVAIFLGAWWFLGRGEGSGVPVAATIPKPKPPKPAPVAAPVRPPAPADPRTMATEEVLKAAREALSSKDYAKAMGLYQEALNRDPVNSEALDGLSQARSAYQKQREEQERNEKFIREYQYAVKTFGEQDYAESLRVAWRLIYPDDTLARQLGKRDSVARLIRDGYYNWAVLDLKMENVRGASKNIQDLLEFDANDAEAKRLGQFIRKYVGAPPDDSYRVAVKNLTYRPLQETP
jgi:tetratricopeptide (TPR) repeat protein